jgi:hypothetical protein
LRDLLRVEIVTKLDVEADGAVVQSRLLADERYRTTVGSDVEVLDVLAVDDDVTLKRVAMGGERSGG